MNNRIIDMVESQVIAAIKEPSSIQKAISSNCNIAFLLTGDLVTTKGYVEELQKNNMKVFIHIDFIDGISNTRSAIKYIATEWKPHGIITTKNHLIKFAKEEGLLTIQRIFLIDRAAISKGIEMINACKPDAVEILPGIMPKVIYELTEKIPYPLVAGGLVSDKDEILHSLQAGALAVSTGNNKLWNLGL